MGPDRKIRVLIVDDSAIVRKILTETLAAEPDIEVVGTAPDPIIGLEKIKRLKPDVLTLDVEMPRMDGLTFLKSLMSTTPMPVILISSLAQASCAFAMDALRFGAVDVLAKPSGPYSVGELRENLCSRVRAAARAKLRTNLPATSVEPTVIAPPLPRVRVPSSSAIIAIGASTGGTEAIAGVLTALPENMPPILITQHIPAVFSNAFAQRLNRICRMEVREAKDGDIPVTGLALVAPGGFHMLLTSSGGRYEVRVKEGPLVHYQKPSVDVLFASVAIAAGAHAVGAILTGMGADGAEGLLKMRQNGARTIAQDEASCVVFGMPREAIRAGAAEKTLPLDQIARGLLTALESLSTTSQHRIA